MTMSTAEQLLSLTCVLGAAYFVGRTYMCALVPMKLVDLELTKTDCFL